MIVYRRLLLPTLLLVSCFATLVSSVNILDILEWSVSSKSPELRAEEAEEEAPPPGGQRSCLCDGPSCICCIDFNLTFIDLGGPGCVRMKYLSQSEGFAVNVSYGNSLLHSQLVKGPNPEPTCMNLISRVAQLCARLTELAPTADGLRGCLQLEPTLLGESQLEFPLGCFRSGPDGMSMEPTVTNVTATTETENSTESTTGINTSAIIQAVNESAEEGIAFFSNLLGLAFGKPNGTEVEEEDDEETISSSPVKVTTVQPETLSQSPEGKQQRKSKQIHRGFRPNEI